MQLLHCQDNLDFLRGMHAESVDLIYLDPPYYSQKDYGEFNDKWSSRRDYLEYITSILQLCHRILKTIGSIYLHCDYHMSHRLRCILDDLFGEDNFRNEIIWCYTGAGTSSMKQFSRKHDNIYWYSKSDKWVFNRDSMRVPYSDPKQTLRLSFHTKGDFDKHNVNDGKVLEDWWTEKESGLSRVVRSPVQNTKYPTQKPIGLLERIIKASSNEDDLVLDPFLGSGTTAVACKRLNRRFIGIDKNPKSIEITRSRLQEILI